MSAFLKSLFSEKGDVSMMRVLSLISLLIGGYLAIIGKDTSVSIFVLGALGAKAGQKIIEVNKS
jgi:hypothetical protein